MDTFDLNTFDLNHQKYGIVTTIIMHINIRTWKLLSFLEFKMKITKKSFVLWFNHGRDIMNFNWTLKRWVPALLHVQTSIHGPYFAQGNRFAPVIIGLEPGFLRSN